MYARNTAIAAALLGAVFTHSAAAQNANPFPAFSHASEASRMHIDYSVWSDLLHDMVLNVPQMDREPERMRTVNTGTRISTANESRYRFEANRVAYHLMSDEYRNAVTTYRAELEALPSQIDFSRLNRNEQLAYWMNLHNVAIVEQVMLNYPVTYIHRMNAHGTRENVFEAKILNVAGQPLSLNDIRLRIVFQQWDDPRVMYGFFNGAIGGPELPRNAFDATRIWSQLDDNAEEFVNSLRGVEVARRELRVSHLYRDAAPLFPDFESDLRAHLRQYANEETQAQLSGNRPLAPSVEDWHVADLINGSTRCTGPAGPATMYSSRPETAGRGEPMPVATSCASLPPNALVLLDAVFDRRIELIGEGRYGNVRTIDLPTVDPDAQNEGSADEDSGASPE